MTRGVCQAVPVAGMYGPRSIREVLAALALAGTLLALRWLYRRMRSRPVRRLLAPRPQRAPAEFAETFYGDSETTRTVALQVMAVLSRNVPVDLGGLDPRDDFVDDLRLPRLDKLAMLQIRWDLERELQISIKPEDADRLRSFEEIMRFLGASQRAQRLAQDAQRAR